MKTIKQAAKEFAESEIMETYDSIIEELKRISFIHGAKFAQQWISVEDELPEIKNKRYQIHIKYKNGVDIYDTLTIVPSICTKENLLEILNELNITHWRPINIV